METILIKAKEWFRSLSINEQREFANKHLASYEVAMLIGNLSRYTSLNKWNELHIKLYQNFQKNVLVVSK